MITSQTLGTTLHPINAGGRRIDTAIALVRAAAARRKSEPDAALLREQAPDAADGIDALLGAAR